MTDADLCAAASAAYTAPDAVAYHDVHAVLTETGGTVVVAFRGTRPASWHDWFRDFDALPMAYPGLGDCHRGFLTGAFGALVGVRNAIAGRPYVLTGHSLGGALALATGALMTLGGHPPLRLTTFGAPRVGMAEFRRVLSTVPGQRFRCGDDPVPELPVWPYLNDRAWTRIGTASDDPIDDHEITAYMAGIRSAA